MKKILTLFAALVLLAVGATAQKLSYSAVVRNSANELVANQTLTVAISIANSETGAAVYSETHTATTNQNGLVTLVIGDGTGTTGSMSDVTWSTAYITSNYTLPDGAHVINTVPVTAVPYALSAGNVEGGGASANDGTLTIQKNGVTVGTFTANQSGNETVNITITAQDIIDAVNGMSETEKAALCAALNCGGGGDEPEPTHPNCGTMTDADGHEYETVVIGTQCWTKTNLRVAVGTDGTNLTSNNGSNTEPFYYVNSDVNDSIYGYYYNWEAAKLACPSGWHLPSDAEWTTMEATQTDMDVTGTGSRGDHAGKLADGGWHPSSTAGAPGDATDANHNVSGFSAVPAGHWNNGVAFMNLFAYFWSSTEIVGTDNAYYRYLGHSFNSVRRYSEQKLFGYSVRCVKGDATSGGGETSECPSVNLPNNTFYVTQDAEYFKATINYTGGDGNEEVSSTNNSMPIDGYVTLDKVNKTITVNMPQNEALQGYGYVINITITLTDGTCDPVELSCQEYQGGEPTTFTCGTSKMTDADGNEYETVVIGTQCWTKTNLRVAVGTSPDTLSYTAAHYYVNPSVDDSIYGYYYNWKAAELACPSGWHLPSDAEWTTMEATQTSMDVTGTGWRGDHAGKLAGGDDWSHSYTSGAPGNATDANYNVSGFSAVPAGYWNSGFHNAGRYAYFWSSTEKENEQNRAYYRYLYFDDKTVGKFSNDKNYGYSVRCLRD